LEFNLPERFDAMLLLISLLFFALPIVGGDNNIIEQLRTQLAFSKRSEHDPVLAHLCRILPTPEFIKATSDQDFIRTVIGELGFEGFGVKPNSWAARYQASPHRHWPCFYTLYSIATSAKSMTFVTTLRELIQQCCLSNNDL